MRMWLVPPSHMCRKHLWGEHGTAHASRQPEKGKSITGFLSGGWSIRVGCMNGTANWSEMEQRGYAHNSPLKEEECRSTRNYDCSTARTT